MDSLRRLSARDTEGDRPMFIFPASLMSPVSMWGLPEMRTIVDGEVTMLYRKPV